MFTPCYYPSPKKLSLSPSIDRDILKIHIPIFDPQMTKHNTAFPQRDADIDVEWN